MTTAARYLLDPNAVLDFAVDWTAWLAESETITDHDVLPSEGITVDSSDEASGVVTVWVSSAEPSKQTATVRITTNQGRTDDRTLTFFVTER